MGRGRAARDPRRARGCMDRRGLSGPYSRGLYDTALARGTGRGWLRGRRLFHAVHLAGTLALYSREKWEVPRLRTEVALGGCGRLAGRSVKGD